MEAYILKDNSAYSFIGRIAAFPAQNIAAMESYIKMSDAEQSTTYDGQNAAEGLRAKARRTSHFASALLPLLLKAVEFTQSEEEVRAKAGHAILTSRQVEMAMREALRDTYPEAFPIMKRMKPDTDFRLVREESPVDEEDKHVFSGDWLKDIKTSPRQQKDFAEALFSMNEIREIFMETYKQQIVPQYGKPSSHVRVM